MTTRNRYFELQREGKCPVCKEYMDKGDNHSTCKKCRDKRRIKQKLKPKFWKKVVVHKK